MQKLNDTIMNTENCLFKLVTPPGTRGCPCCSSIAPAQRKALNKLSEPSNVNRIAGTSRQANGVMKRGRGRPRKVRRVIQRNHPKPLFSTMKMISRKAYQKFQISGAFIKMVFSAFKSKLSIKS